QLVDLLKHGKEAAFTEIFDRYQALLFTHAYHKLRDEAEARDVVQDVFVWLWEKRHELEINGNLPGYLYKAVRNRIFNLIKHKKVIEHYADSFFEASIENYNTADHLIREKQ